MAVKIITDSTADISNSLIQALDIEVLSENGIKEGTFTINADGETIFIVEVKEVTSILSLSLITNNILNLLNFKPTSYT